MRISDWSSDVCSSDLEGGKRLSVLAWLGVVACAAVAWCKPAWQSWRRPLLYLALAVLLSTSVVAWMKSWTHVDCPWDLVGFGGTRSYHDLLAALPAHVPHGHCFPAGHASAGYAWVALFFFFGRTRPRSEEHTSELQSLMRISYAVFCLKKKKQRVV